MSRAEDSDRSLTLMLIAFSAVLGIIAIVVITRSRTIRLGACQATCAAAGYTVSEPAEGDTCRCWTPVVVPRLGAGEKP